MLIDEPVVALRGLSMTLESLSGVLLPLDTNWVSGMVKVATTGGYADADALPTPIADGGAGAFDLQFSSAEVANYGSLRVRVFDDAANLIAEYEDSVSDAAGDYVALDQPLAALRTLSASLVDSSDVAIPAGTSWVAGMAKVSKAGAAFVNAANLPVAVSGAGDGAFSLELSTGEVDTEGRVRVRFYDASAVLLREYVVVVREALAAETNPGVVDIGTTATESSIRDRAKSLIEAIVPTADSRVRFRSYRNEGGADFETWANDNPASAHRRFQARGVGDETAPAVTNTTTDMREMRVTILVAYPQTGRWGADGALDRDDVMDLDWGLINGQVGIYGMAGFTDDGAAMCTCLGAEKIGIRKGTTCDLLEISARFAFYRRVT